MELYGTSFITIITQFVLDHYYAGLPISGGEIKERIKNSLLLFDVGGKTSPENKLIMSEATHAVILAKTEADVIEWQNFCRNQLKKTIQIIAIIYSDYNAKEDKVEKKVQF